MNNFEPHKALIPQGKNSDFVFWKVSTSESHLIFANSYPVDEYLMTGLNLMCFYFFFKFNCHLKIQVSLGCPPKKCCLARVIPLYAMNNA